jgi:hypothetical protein
VSDATGGRPGETIGGRVQGQVQQAYESKIGAPSAVDAVRKQACESCGGTWNQEAQACLDAAGNIISDPANDSRCAKNALPWCLATNPLGANCLGPAARVGAAAAIGGALGGAGGLVVGKSSTGAAIGLFSGVVLGGLAGYLSTKVV